MSRVVAIHGIGQQFEGPQTLHSKWLPALQDGLAHAVAAFTAKDLTCAFYGDLFRPSGVKARREPAFDHRDVDPEYELALLCALWAHAAALDANVAGPDQQAKVRTPLLAQRALRALSGSRFFSGLTERLLIADLKQVGAYLRDQRVRGAVQSRVAAAIADDTTVLVGHSLGAVVAYEAVACGRHPGVVALVTLGAPLGIPNLIFDRLIPEPVDGIGAWPMVNAWYNIADRGDVVALVKQLAPLFGQRVDDRLVHNGATAHDVRPYLTAAETGTAIAAALAAR